MSFNAMMLTFMVSTIYWFSSWLAMELVGFVFMIILSVSVSNSSFKKVSNWKYFMYQCVGSILFLVCMFLKVNQIIDINSYTMHIIMMAGLMMKLGLPPFHKWAFEVSENLMWYKFILVNSMQKIPSLILVWNLMEMDWPMILLSSFGMIYSLAGLFDWSLRRFLVFSSILNYSWIILCSTVDSLAMGMYLCIYLWTFVAASLMISKYSFSSFSFLFNNNSLLSMGPLLNAFMAVNIMSLASLPPLAGFIAKYEVIMTLIWNGMIILSVMYMLISMTLLVMYITMLVSTMVSNKLLNEVFTRKDLYTIVFSLLNLVIPLLYFL
nr:NADH dehydrogenase subunit 2 [Anaticola crassicornis]